MRQIDERKAEMRSRYKRATVALAIVAALSVMLVSSAFASEWAAKTGQWQQAGTLLSGSVGTVWKGTVKMKAPALGFGTSYTVECSASGEGSAGPGGFGSETKWKLSSCVRLEGSKPVCEAVEAPSMVDLPWLTELSASGSQDVASSEGKMLGFRFECNGVFGKFAEECTAKTLSAGIENVAGGVESTFAIEKIPTCTLRGEPESGHTGSLEGAQLIEATKGGKLESTSAFGKLAAPLAITATTNLAVTDIKGGNRGLSCPGSMEGTLEAGGVGKITSYAVEVSHCNLEKCPHSGRVGPVNLPWKTELYSEGEKIKERLVSGGSGAPGWEFTCEGVEDLCTLSSSAKMSNTLEGNVLATFGEEEKLSCRVGGAGAGQLVGTITIPHPAGVQAIEVR